MGSIGHLVAAAALLAAFAVSTTTAGATHHETDEAAATAADAAASAADSAATAADAAATAAGAAATAVDEAAATADAAATAVEEAGANAEGLAADEAGAAEAAAATTEEVPAAAEPPPAVTATATPAPPTASAQPDLARGLVLFDNCSQCHGREGAGNLLFGAPAIAGFPQWYVESQLRNFQGGLRGLHPEDVEGMRMRPMSLALRSDEDLVAVSAYVASLPPTDLEPTLDGDATRGAQLYGPCVACHRPDGGGMEAINSPPLTGTHDWYLLTQLHKYKDGVRGSNPKDQNGALMRAMAGTLADDQAMRDIVAHIMTLD